MQIHLSQLSQQAREAVQRREWHKVRAYALKILEQNTKEPEGYFLCGLAEKAAGNLSMATSAFSKALSLDARRYDAAVELANQYILSLRYGEAFELLGRYRQEMDNSPLYLFMAAQLYTRLGMHSYAWPLLEKADLLQPGVDSIRANLAACAVLLGKVEIAKAIYLSLLKKYPNHQKNHYELSKLVRVKDSAHVEQMQKVLEHTQLPPEKNIFIYYAIGKELEDLGRWQESFGYYQMAGNAILDSVDYDVADDIKVIQKVISVCDSDWLSSVNAPPDNRCRSKTPIFIVGLPRTGTTLTERIVASHSQVESADETFFMQTAIRDVCKAEGFGDLTTNIVEQAAKANIFEIAEKYLDLVSYRLVGKPFFIDKYPYNFIHLGFIAKAFPDARIIYLRRNPMDACFALYKQSFFKFAYSLEDLGRYYVAQDQLRAHWQSVLGERLIEVDYEDLVADQESKTREILARLGLKFEQSCMDFEQNPSASATASTLQVREKIHARSVNKWKNYAKELQPLKNYLDEAGINTEER